jgi:hypothetical protein
MSTRSIRNTEILRAKIAAARAKTAREVAGFLAEAAGFRVAFLKAVDAKVRLEAAIDAKSAEEGAEGAGSRLGMVIFTFPHPQFAELILSGDQVEIAVTRRGWIIVRAPYCRTLHALLLRLNRAMRSPRRAPIEAVLRSRADTLPPRSRSFLQRIVALL